MKQCYLLLASLAVQLLCAQIPSNGLVFRQEFNGNYNETSSTNATPSANTSSLTTDMYGVANKAASLQMGQSIRYPFSSYSALMAGSVSKEITLSCHVKLDSAYVENLSTADQYLNVVKNGECFIRFRKSGSGTTKILFLQVGVFNNGPNNFGYTQVTYLLKDYTPGNSNSDSVNYKHNRWNNFAFRYFPSVPGNGTVPTLEAL